MSFVSLRASVENQKKVQSSLFDLFVSDNVIVMVVFSYH